MQFWLSASNHSCSAKTTILGVPGASFWDPWGGFWCHLEGPGLSLGSHGGFLATGGILTHFPPRILVHFGYHSGTQFLKSRESAQKNCVRKAV